MRPACRPSVDGPRSRAGSWRAPRVQRILPPPRAGRCTPAPTRAIVGRPSSATSRRCCRWRCRRYDSAGAVALIGGLLALMTTPLPRVATIRLMVQDVIDVLAPRLARGCKLLPNVRRAGTVPPLDAIWESHIDGLGGWVVRLRDDAAGIRDRNPLNHVAPQTCHAMRPTLEQCRAPEVPGARA